jgi:hypothetical protein
MWHAAGYRARVTRGGGGQAVERRNSPARPRPSALKGCEVGSRC